MIRSRQLHYAETNCNLQGVSFEPKVNFFLKADCFRLCLYIPIELTVSVLQYTHFSISQSIKPRNKIITNMYLNSLTLNSRYALIC